MLQFSEDFLQPEIRNDFYIDSTMKTVWATALELLQTMAEVCDKYGLEWYAAYGTLLGAIRHEGFIPWDDDLDIWMKRADYQKLLQVLPGELPEGYHVLSSQTEEGYGQFHTCVVCGEGISIEPQYLERHYGCPFRVGVDIFPLDYLPRDEALCKQQKNVFLLAKRIAQTVQEYQELVCSEDISCGAQRDRCIKEIREGLRFLESSCGYIVGWQGVKPLRLLEQGQWDKIISAVYRIANDAVRHCREQDADYLVMYRDYANNERKIFPKEWFDEIWGATFENVMLPIPWEYDQVLQRIYGNYHVCHRGGTSHDYPYYERQLEELRGLVRQRVGSTEGNEDEGISPIGWEKLLGRGDGTRKKIVLYTNDISDFITYGEAALDKLESVLQIFYEAREQILLWWRPQAEMSRALALAEQSADQPTVGATAAPKLSERYHAILERYKAAGWGICDESSDKLRAVETCNAYYGPGNTLVSKFQGRGKPIMLAAGK